MVRLNRAWAGISSGGYHHRVASHEGRLRRQPATHQRAQAHQGVEWEGGALAAPRGRRRRARGWALGGGRDRAIWPTRMEGGHRSLRR